MFKIRDKYLFVFNKLFDRYVVKKIFLESRFIILTLIFFYTRFIQPAWIKMAARMLSLYFCSSFFYFERHDNGN